MANSSRKANGYKLLITDENVSKEVKRLIIDFYGTFAILPESDYRDGLQSDGYQIICDSVEKAKTIIDWNNSQNMLSNYGFPGFNEIDGFIRRALININHISKDAKLIYNYNWVSK